MSYWLLPLLLLCSQALKLFIDISSTTKVLVIAIVAMTSLIVYDKSTRNAENSNREAAQSLRLQMIQEMRKRGKGKEKVITINPLSESVKGANEVHPTDYPTQL